MGYKLAQSNIVVIPEINNLDQIEADGIFIHLAGRLLHTGRIAPERSNLQLSASHPKACNFMLGFFNVKNSLFNLLIRYIKIIYPNSQGWPQPLYFTCQRKKNTHCRQGCCCTFKKWTLILSSDV